VKSATQACVSGSSTVEFLDITGSTAGTKIHWRFNRRAARRKFRYNKNFYKRSKN